MSTERDLVLQDILEKLEAGVRSVYSSREWQEYLKVMARFHTYSFSNCILIYLQKPDASLVAGYNVWNKEFHRQVMKGEKGIRILAPMKRKTVIGGEEEGTWKITGFRPVYVFDVSQTEGDPVPVNLCETLQGKVDHYFLFLEALLLASPVPVHFAQTAEGVNGYYRPLDDEIIVRSGMSEAQTVKTLLHEIAHALLHKDNRSSEHSARVQREVEAESVAYAVSSYYGIDTSSYSFGYIAAYADDRELHQLRESLAAIQRTADHIITLVNHVRNPVPGSRNKKPAFMPAYANHPLSF